MGFQTADGQNGEPRSVHAYNPRLCLCARGSPPGSEFQRARPFLPLEGCLCAVWQGLGTTICRASAVEVSVCSQYPAANQCYIQTSVCFGGRKSNVKGRRGGGGREEIRIAGKGEKLDFFPSVKKDMTKVNFWDI